MQFNFAYDYLWKGIMYYIKYLYNAFYIKVKRYQTPLWFF